LTVFFGIQTESDFPYKSLKIILLVAVIFQKSFVVVELSSVSIYRYFRSLRACGNAATCSFFNFSRDR
jgi:hypothetical protein